MATILLQAVGGAVGGLIGGPFGAVLGRAVGGLGGYALDSALFGTTRRSEGARLGASRIMEADEGAGVPRLYGTARIAGQVIWATRFEETSQTERQGGKGGGQTSETTTYSYAGNFAVGLCEGPIAGIRRVWADGEELDLTGVTLRVYRGGEDQMPDPLIEAKQGMGNAPAYRGLAYAVFERLALEPFGNRLPQIACEVIRPVGTLEERVRAVTLIPGATEHGLDPAPVRETVRGGEDVVLNRHATTAATDLEAALDDLEGLCPKLQRVALAVTWFGDDLRAGHCRIRPAVEVAQRDETRAWQVNGVGRAEAPLVSWSGGGPAYGGTPNDAGVVDAIRALAARALAVTYYPFLLMDVPAGNGLPDPYGAARQADYPWRGRISLDVAVGRPGSVDGSAAASADIARFAGTALPAHFSLAGGRVSYSGPPEWSYRRMVLHQAFLAKLAGGVDAFVIGSEMRGLTRVRDGAGGFPFVAALMALAADVKTVLPEAKLGYAADWSEYFGYQPADGSGDVFYNLDPLWAHPAIAFVGIDNYLPLADWRAEDAGGGGPDGARSAYDLDALRRGITGGEHADWYYRSDADRAARTRTAITDGAAAKPWVYRAKDIARWWAEPHVERRGGVEVGGPTAWVPRSKPIWLTELGCPAVDKGANQPNVFVDPKSSESFIPYFSTGARDDLIQRRFLDAHLSWWDPAVPGFDGAANPLSPVYGGRMVEPSAIHLWTWDARPFPAFPGRTDVWRDGDNWRLGHWLNGRLGAAPVGDLIRRLLADHGFTDVDVAGVDALVGGYVVGGPGTARAQLEDLLRLTGVVCHADGTRLVFRSLANLPAGRPISVYAEEDGPLVEFRRREASEIPDEVVVGFSDPGRSYQPAAAEALLALADSPRQETIELPVTLEESQARRFAADLLSDLAGARETVRFSLSPAEIAAEAGDVLQLADVPGRWLVTRIESGATRRVEARRLPEAGERAAERTAAALPAPVPTGPTTASRPLAHFLDLPMGTDSLPEAAPRLAVFAAPFLPVVVEAAGGGGFARRLVISAAATLGTLTAALPPGPEGRIDAANSLTVDLSRGALASIGRDALLSGGNLSAVLCANGEWEVLQFETAEEVAPMRFRLTGLLRAQGGTEDAMAAGAAPGAAFVLLDGGPVSPGLRADEIGRALDWRLSPAGRPLDDPAVLVRTVTLGLRAVRPLSPVQLSGRFLEGGALALGWIRRTRLGGDGWDGLDVPLGEEIERYRVDLVDAAGTRLVLETPGPAATVSLAEQVAAFGTAPTALDVAVAQLSLSSGAGTARHATVARPS